MRRFGQVIGLQPEFLEEYVRLHEAVWPGVLATLAGCHIRNYSIFLYDHTLFAYFEYHGSDFDADMERRAADRLTQAWWALCKPMQRPLVP